VHDPEVLRRSEKKWDPGVSRGISRCDWRRNRTWETLVPLHGFRVVEDRRWARSVRQQKVGAG